MRRLLGITLGIMTALGGFDPHDGHRIRPSIDVPESLSVGEPMRCDPAAVDHIHLLLSIPPKYSVSNTVGFLKGKSAVRIHRELLREKRLTGLHFWATGYWVCTVGRDEEAVRKYIREQEGWDREQGELFDNQ